MPDADAGPLSIAIQDAIRHRKDLRTMGQRAREDTERRAGIHCLTQLREWIFAKGAHLA